MFMEQRVTGTLKIWQEPFVALRFPNIFNLRMDPYERAQITSNTYYDWMFRHIFLLVPAQKVVGEFLATFKEFPRGKRRRVSAWTRYCRNSWEVPVAIDVAVKPVDLSPADLSGFRWSLSGG